MARPDDDRPFPARWHHFVRLLLVESSVKHVAHAAVDYADFTDGTSCRPSNERLVRETGLSEKTVRTAWAVLRGLGMAERVTWHTSYRGIADEYYLTIPQGWTNMALLGPRGRKFVCQFCGKQFNPKGNCTVDADEQVGFLVHRFAFCNGNADCAALWDQRERSEGRPGWKELGGDRWKLFRLARDDDW